MAISWQEVSAKPEYKALSSADQEATRDLYFKEVVAPQVPVDKIDATRTAFDSDTKPRLLDGVSNTIKAVAKGLSRDSVMDGNMPITSPQAAARHGIRMDNGKLSTVSSRAMDISVDRALARNNHGNSDAPAVEPDTMAETLRFMQGREDPRKPEQVLADASEISTRNAERAKQQEFDREMNLVAARKESLRVLARSDTPEGVNARRILAEEGAQVVADTVQRNYANANQITSDTANDIRIGVAKVPGAFVGLMDIAPAMIVGGRPADVLFDAIGKQTGFQPKEYAKKLEQNYSDIRKQGAHDISAVWDDETQTWWDVTKAYANNPRVTAGTIIQSIPAMVAGGAIGRAIMLRKAGIAPAAIQKSAIAPAAIQKSAIAAGAVGEGAIMAGMQMDGIDRSVDPRIAALASLATGIMGAAVGKYSGAMASKLGIRDVDTLLAGGAVNAVAMPFYRRIPAAMVQEGIIEEGTQSSMEQMLKNIAEDKPVTQGVARATVESILAGSVMGGVVALPSGGQAAKPIPTLTRAAQIAAQHGITPPSVPVGAERAEVPANELAQPPERAATSTGEQVAPPNITAGEQNGPSDATGNLGLDTGAIPSGADLAEGSAAVGLPGLGVDAATSSGTGLLNSPGAPLGGAGQGGAIRGASEAAEALTATPERRTDTAGRDALYNNAVEVVVKSGNGSMFTLLRNMKQLNHARAERLMNQMEANGVVGPKDGKTGLHQALITDIEQAQQAERTPDLTKLNVPELGVKQETPTSSKDDIAAALRNNIETLTKRRNVIDQIHGISKKTYQQAIEKAKLAMQSGKGDHAYFTKMAKTFKGQDDQIYTSFMSIAESLKQTRGAVAVRKPQKASSDLLQRIKQLGGIDSANTLDITGEKRAPGGWKFAFRKGGKGLDDLATQLASDGFKINTNDVDGGVQQLRDMIEAHINGERNFKAATQEQAAEGAAYSDDMMALAQHATELGINIKGLSDQEIRDAVYEEEDQRAMAEQDAAGLNVGEEEFDEHDEQAITALADQGQDVPFGNEVRTDPAALARWLGEENGETDQGNGENTNGRTGEQAQSSAERGGDGATQSQGTGQEALQSYTQEEITQRELDRRAQIEAEVRASGEAARAERQAADQARITENVNNGAAADAFSMTASEPVSKAEQKRIDKEKAKAELGGQVDLLSQPTKPADPMTQMAESVASLANSVEKLISRDAEQTQTAPDANIENAGQSEAQQRKQSQAVQKQALTTIGGLQPVVDAAANTPDAFRATAEQEIVSWVGTEINAAILAGDHTRAKATSELLTNGKPNLPDAFYDGLLKEAKQNIKAKKKTELFESSREAFNKAAVGVETADAPNFSSGWGHALDGKTKSTLPTGEAYAKGYDAAQKWLKTPDGKAAHSGKRVNKLENTGADLRRWFDEQKAKIKDGDTNAIIAALENATSRADMFRDIIGQDATPGAQRYIDMLRNKIYPFKRWLMAGTLSLRNSNGGKNYYSQSEAERLREYLEGEISLYKQDQSRNDRIQTLKDAASEYTNQVLQLTQELEGKTVNELAASFKALMFKDGLGSPNSYRDDQYTEAGLQIKDNIFIDDWRGVRNMYYMDSETNYALKSLVGTEQTTAESTRKAPLTPPRLDHIERDGADYRKAGNVEPIKFKNKFNFADVGFGKWVNSKQDQDHLNYSYDAFMDLAELLNIPSEAISLGGRLHFTIGALGHGKFAAHYTQAQPHPDGGTVPVINVTNTKGDGTVAHEWGHALDLTQQGDNTGLDRAIEEIKKNLVYGYDMAMVRPSVVSMLQGQSYWSSSKRSAKSADGRIENAKRSIQHYASPSRNQSLYYREAQKLDGNKAGKDPYWSNHKELFARAFEAWVGDTLEGKSDYLVNTEWTGDGNVTDKTHRGTPYPVGEERERINKWFDALSISLKYDAGNKVLVLDQEAWNENKPTDAADWKTALADLEAELPSMAEGLLREEDAKRQDAARAVEHAASMQVGDQVVKREVYRRTDQDGEPRIIVKIEARGSSAYILLTLDNGSQEYAQHFEVTQRKQTESIIAPQKVEPVGELSEHDLEQLFDEAAAELQESTQEQPEAKAPGEDVIDIQDDEMAASQQNKEKAENLFSGRSGKIETNAEKTASKLAAEAAKHGVKGIDEALTGLVKLFGVGPGKLHSFPGNLNKETYEQAKPHFEAALKAFQEAGKSIKDLFKFLIENFGVGVKPYAVHFAKEKNLTSGLGNKPSASRQVANYVKAKLETGIEVSWQDLFTRADAAWEGTQAEGKYNVKDAYDAMELGVNLYLRDMKLTSNTNTEAAISVVDRLTKLIDKLPTQTKRTAEMDEFQQFSTPPALAYVASWVANINANDTLLEPSAGTGDLAIYADNMGAKLILNELSSRRAEILKELYPDARIFTENAEQLNNILPKDAAPTVVIMNPPFSSTAGRVEGSRSSENGARHVEQALKRLPKNGRLVAITGGLPAKWLKKMQEKYNFRAMLDVSGKEYAKYGTTFDNKLIVIDNNGKTGDAIVTGRAESIADLPKLLEGVRNDKPLVSQSDVDQSSSKKDSEKSQGQVGSKNANGDSTTDAVGDNEQQIGAGANLGDGAELHRPTSQLGGRDSSSGKNQSTPTDAVSDGNGQPGAQRNESGRDGSGRGGSGADDGTDNGGTSAAGKSGGLTVGTTKTKHEGEISNSLFENYKPQRLAIPGAKEHPGKLVQSSAMAAVEPPAPNYTPNLPKELIENGWLSLAQLEAVVYAGMAHQQMLPNGERRGYFIGDGTGVGKGREISGIIMDNMRQGQKKAVWVSFNEGLLNDAQRDFSGIGGNKDLIFWQGKTKPANAIPNKEGFLFTTYSTLKGGEKKQANDLGQKQGRTRLDQIVDWLGKDYDGVIVFDEAHSMGNIIAIKGKRGTKKPSQQAIAGANLQRMLPMAKVVYVSATGATEVSNLGYASRLGLWGEGTAFADVKTFIANVSEGGVASMELISRDMKALGMYIARSLSYDGVTYQRLEHQLSPLQNDIYNELAKAWQVVLQNVNAALETSNGAKNGSAKSAAMSAFWGSHQRFFNQVITSLQTPSVIEDMHKQIAAGNSIVLQLTNTNEATQEREVAKAAAEGIELEELDFTPRQMLMEYVRNSFPVAAYQKSTDPDGNTVYVPVTDAAGNPVFDQDAVALRDKLLATLEHIRVPENPIDAIIEAFGSEKVGEVTGRARRFIQKRDEQGNIKVVEEKRGKHSSQNDAAAFQSGKKPILIFSQAGGTGYSFHADNSAKNQSKRIHYILQPGWRADAAVQGFGRTHRTNQKQEPHYVLPTTNLKAQKRFVSSIARRLDQLGALTKGERQANSQGLFTASDNLESKYASDALTIFFQDLHRGKTPLDFSAITAQMGIDNLIDKKTGAFNEGNIPEIPKFLNRLLSLESHVQDDVFAQFELRLDEVVNFAIQQGTFDNGMQTLKAESIKKVRDDVAHTDERTGAETRYVEIDVTNPIKYRTWNEAQTWADSEQSYKGFAGWYTNAKGEIFGLASRGERLNAKGEVTHRGVLYSTRDGHTRYVDNFDQYKAGWKWAMGVKKTIATPVPKGEAQAMWEKQVAEAPRAETTREHMVVGVILPIWDRVKGHPRIVRLQTDEGERMIGRVMGAKDAKDTLKNLGLESSVAKMSVDRVLSEIAGGAKALLANGWDIKIVRVSGDVRMEISKPSNYFTSAEQRLLTEQGAFIERIQWEERVFIPSGENQRDIFERITQSKPVVDLVGGKKGAAQDDTPSFNRKDTNKLAAALAKYEDTGEFLTVSDLANEIDALIVEDKAPESLLEAIDNYRQELADDHAMAGRGDTDTAEEAFLDEVRAAVRAESNGEAKFNRKENQADTPDIRFNRGRDSVDKSTQQADSNAYEIQPKTARVLPINGPELIELRRAAAAIESPEKGITFTVSQDGKAIATGPAGIKVPDRFQRFADKHNLALVVQRLNKELSSEGHVTYSNGQLSYLPNVSTVAGRPMPIAYRESGALYFGEIGDHMDRTGSARFNRGEPGNRIDTDLQEAHHATDEELDTLRRSIQASVQRPLSTRAYRNAQLPDAENLGKLASAFAKRVVGLSTSVPAQADFNGVVLTKSLPDLIFLNAKADRPHMAILGHELVHHLRTTRPELYQQFSDAIRPYIKDNYPEFAKDYKGETADRIKEEFLAEIVSDGTMNPKFWDALGKSNPSLLKRIVGIVHELIRKAMAAMGYNNKTEKYLRDFDRVMEIAGEVMGKYGLDPKTTNGTGQIDEVKRMDSRKPANPFYSQLEKAVRTMPDKLFQNGTNLKLHLVSNMSKYGIKKEELHWSGVLDWLQTQGKVSKADVLGYLQGNGVTVQEVVLGDRVGKDATKEIDRLYKEALEREASDTDGDFWYEALKDQARREGIETSDLSQIERDELLDRAMPFDERVAEIKSAFGVDMKQRISDQVNEEAGYDDTKYTDTKFATHVPPGGKPGTYRELLLTLPEKEYEYPEVIVKRVGNWVPNDPTEGKWSVTVGGKNQGFIRAFDEAEAKHKAVDDARNTVENKQNFRSSHFDQPNILAHLRVDEVEGANGERLLRVVEIQSDMQAANRKALDEVSKPYDVRELAEKLFNRDIASVMSLEAGDGGMLSLLQNDKVRRDVVARIPVDVVNLLATYKLSPKDIFNNDPVLSTPVPVGARSRIGLGVLNAIRETGANLRAKLHLAYSSGVDATLLPTLNASDLPARSAIGVMKSAHFDHVSLLRGSGLGDIAGAGAEVLTGTSDVTGGLAINNPAISTSRGMNNRDAGARAEASPGAGGGGKAGSASLASLVDWHNSILKDSSSQVKLFRAPFAEKTESYISLSVKKAIVFAAQNGMDGIVFATGQQNADLYDLSKQVSRVVFTNDGRLLAYDKNSGNTVIDKEIPESEIEDYIGKDAAKKLLAAPVRTIDSIKQRVIEGGDLKIGGTGMMKFYNEIVPQVADKVLKQIGADVKVTDILFGQKKYDKMFEDTEPRDIPLQERPKQPGFLLTPSILSKVRNEGLPLFNRKEAATYPTKQPEQKRSRMLRIAKKSSMEKDTSVLDHVLGGKFAFQILNKLLSASGAKAIASHVYTNVLNLAGKESIADFIPENVRAGIVSDYGLDGQYTDRKSEMKAAEAAQNRKSAGMVEMLAALTRAESRVAYQWMQEKPDTATEQDLLANLPKESRETLTKLKQMVSNLGKEAVRLGQMSHDAYERNNMAYLHRTYAKHVLDKEGVLGRFMRTRAMKIKGNQYKGRGIFDDVSMNAVGGDQMFWRKLQAGKADKSLMGEKVIRFERRDASTEAMDALHGMVAKPLGKLREVMYWPASQPIPAKYGDWVNAGNFEVRDVNGDKLVVWRDYTKAERERMGELDEVRYAVAQTLQMMAHDIEIGRFFEWTAKRYGKISPDGKEMPSSESMLRTYGKDEWVLVPSSNIPNTKTKKYGALAGLYVPGPVWNDIRQTTTNITPFGETYEKLLQFWKKSKTAWSPGVHMNNVMANFVMADWHDLKAIDLAEALSVWAHKDSDAGFGKLYQRFEDSGALGGMFLSNETLRDEIGKRLKEIKDELTGEQEAKDESTRMAKVLHLVTQATMLPVKVAKGYTGKAEDMYQFEDSIFRLAAFVKAVRYGKSDIEAGRLARHSFLNYDINAPWIQAARHTGLPFISFFYRALPMAVDTAKHKPWKIVKLLAFYSMVSALGGMAAGGDDDEERKNLPKEKQGRVWGIVPKMVRMPWNHNDGSPYYLDIRRWVPVGDIADTETGSGMLPPWATPSGPIVLLTEAMLANKSFFTEKDIVKDTDTQGEKLEKRLDHLFKSMLPNVPLPNPINLQTPYGEVNPFNMRQGSMQPYAWSAIEKSALKREGAIGEVRTSPAALASAFGIKVSAYPKNNMLAAKIIDKQKRETEIKAELKMIARNYANIEKPTESEVRRFEVDKERQIRKLKEVAEEP